MALRGFAPRTQETYVNWMARLVSQTRVVADQLTEVQVRTYLASLSQAGLSASTLNQAISAIRFFFNLGGAGWAARVMGNRFPEAKLLPPLYFVLLVILLFAFGLMRDCTFNPRGCDL